LHRLFYKKIIIEGRENIPGDAPVIFAPNHQNALMDPLAVLFTAGNQVVFLARADIFKSKILARFFYWLKILPVYRIRDGADNLRNNDHIFDSTVKVLEHHRSIGLFPEAAHSNKRHLLSFKKGVPRIAFQAEEAHQGQLGIQIVPVGIYYSEYTFFRSTIHIRYGKPIKVSDYYEDFKINPNKGMMRLRDEMMAKTESLVINFRDLDFYETYTTLACLFWKHMDAGPEKKKENRRFAAFQEMGKKLDELKEKSPEKMAYLDSLSQNLNGMLKKSRLRKTVYAEKPKTLWLTMLQAGMLILFLPVFIFGLLNNLISYLTPKLFVLKVKDAQFYSSIKFVWSIFVVPILYLLQTLIVYFVIRDVKIALLYLASLPVSAMLSQFYWEMFFNFSQTMQLRFLRWFYPEKYKQLQTTYQALKSVFEEVLTI
jgi:1-acyl-sn-glycerol-3-phosphate acyltransferase